MLNRNPWGCRLPSTSTCHPPRLVPPSVFSGVSTRGTFTSYRALLPSLLSCTPGSLGLPLSLPLAFPRASLCTGQVPGCSCLAPWPPPQTLLPWAVSCCHCVPRESLTAPPQSPNLPSANNFLICLHSKCLDRISWGIWGHVQVRDATQVLSAGWEGKVALPVPLWAFGGTNPALPCRAGAEAAPWSQGQRGQPKQELLGVCLQLSGPRRGV